MFKNKKQKGFTLIEFLIVIAIVIVLFTAVMASQGGFLVKNYSNNYAEQMIFGLRTAQMRSITNFKNDTWGVYFDDTNNKAVLFKGADYSSRDTSYDITTEFPDVLSFSNISLNGGVDYVVFDKVSGETNQYGSISITDEDGKENIININIGGVVALNEQGGGGDGGGDTEADNLVVDASNVKLWGDYWVYNITMENTGSESVTIDKVKVTWSGASKYTDLWVIFIGRDWVWVGNGDSGETFDIEDTTINAGNTTTLEFVFDYYIDGAQLSFDLIMSDGSIVSTNNILLK